MPPAKKPATRKSSRSANGRSVTAPITRKEVEAATARFDKLLDEANTALATMRKDLGKNARVAYKDVADALRKLRRDARGANKTLVKDLEQLAKAVRPGTSSARSTSRSGAAKRATRSTAKAGAAKTGAASRSAAKSKSAGRSTAKSSGTAKRASSGRSTTSRSTTRRSSSS